MRFWNLETEYRYLFEHQKPWKGERRGDPPWDIYLLSLMTRDGVAWGRPSPDPDGVGEGRGGTLGNAALTFMKGASQVRAPPLASIPSPNTCSLGRAAQSPPPPRLGSSRRTSLSLSMQHSMRATERSDNRAPSESGDWPSHPHPGPSRARGAQVERIVLPKRAAVLSEVLLATSGNSKPLVSSDTWRNE